MTIHTGNYYQKNLRINILFRLLSKFEGIEEVRDKQGKNDRSQSARVKSRIYRELVEEQKLCNTFEGEEYRPMTSQVYEYFRDGEYKQIISLINID